MRRIQETALDLFDAHGFENVSIEEIARHAEVSPSSIYRYFGTKEQIVLYDEVDVRLIDRVDKELEDHPPVEAVRRAMTSVLAQYFERDDELTRRKVRYAFEEPALRAASLEQTDAFVPVMAQALATAAGRDPNELEIQVIAAAIIASLIAAVRHWYAGGAASALTEEIDRALLVLENGLPLTADSTAPPRATPRRRTRRQPVPGR
jgi:AcrR family transcriptional regulator